MASAQIQTIPYTTTASGQQIPIPSWVDTVNNNFTLTPAINGTPTAGDCVLWYTSSELGDSGTVCGSGGGGGNVSANGSPTQYQTPAWVSSSLIKGIGPGATGTAYCSGGASAYPSFCTSLSGVTSVNGTTIPPSATLPTVTGTINAGHCVSCYSSGGALQDAGSSCAGGAQLTTITSNTTLSSSACAVLVNAASGNITVTLPTAVGAAYTCIVKRVDSSTNTVTITTSASQTIDGASSVGILFQYTSVTFMSNNANWWQI